MSGLLSYSGITTKVRAMDGHLLTTEQYREMAGLENVPEAVEFLKKQPAYADIFSTMEPEAMHRGAIEQKLTVSLYRDYTRLYKFATLSQRKFLDIYFMHFEIGILKKCLRNAMARKQQTLGLSIFQDFFNRHSKLDLVRISACDSLEEFISNLEGSIYYEPLKQLSASEHATQFDCEMTLDILYFNHIWKAKKKDLSAQEARVIAHCFGSKLDILNLQWIYRAKRYFNIPPDSLKKILIPICYKLKREQISRMAEAGSLEEFFTVLRTTYYGAKFHSAEADSLPDLEALYKTILNRIYEMTSRRNPYSSAILNTYLYNKESELHQIITIVESIRYNVDVNDIIAYACNH